VQQLRSARRLRLGSILAVASLLVVPSVAAAASPWSLGQRLPQPRGAVGAATLGGDIYVAGGEDVDFNARAEVWSYSPRENRWTARPALPQPWVRPALVALDGSLYALKGSSLYRWSPGAPGWTRAADPPNPVTTAAAAVADGKLYVFDGPRVLVYTPGRDRWRAAAAIPAGSGAFTAAARSRAGRLYAFGPQSTYAYAPATGEWRRRAHWIDLRQNISPAVNTVRRGPDGRMYLVGAYGSDGTNFAATGLVEVYDPSRNRWSLGAVAPSFAGEVGLAAADGRLYAVAGYEYPGQFFTPTPTRKVAVYRFADTRRPTIGRARPVIAEASVFPTTVPIELRYRARDASGIAGYHTQRGVGDGPIRDLEQFPWSWQGRPDATGARPGQRFRYRAQVSDGAGNLSRFSAAPAFVPRLRSEESADVAYTGEWRRVSDPDAIGDQRSIASAEGAAARVTVDARAFAWVAVADDRGGRADVFVDGKLRTTVNLFTDFATYNQPAFRISWERRGRHVIRIVVRGGGEVSVDAFATLE
jgi:N-acetylneuraminic acid mutarotase